MSFKIFRKFFLIFLVSNLFTALVWGASPPSGRYSSPGSFQRHPSDGSDSGPGSSPGGLGGSGASLMDARNSTRTGQKDDDSVPCSSNTTVANRGGDDDIVTPNSIGWSRNGAGSTK